jgi:hypothetical protein
MGKEIEETNNINKAAEMLLNSDAYCKFCHKEFSIITCCSHFSYCSHLCRSKDWKRHERECKNVDPRFDKEEEGRMKIYCRSLTTKLYSDKKILELYCHEHDNYQKRGYGPIFLCNVAQKSQEEIQRSFEFDFFRISYDRFGDKEESHLFEKVIKWKVQNPKDCIFFIFCIGTNICNTIVLDVPAVFKYSGSEKSVPISLLPSFLTISSFDPAKFVDRLYTIEIMMFSRLFSIEDITKKEE